MTAALVFLLCLFALIGLAVVALALWRWRDIVEAVREQYRAPGPML